MSKNFISNAFEIERLKGGYWGRLAKNWFIENNKGQKLFAYGGLFANKYYLVDSDEAEFRLLKKIIKLRQTTFWPIVLFVVVTGPSFWGQWQVFLIFLFIIWLLSAITKAILFENEIKKMQKVDQQLTIRDRFLNLAKINTESYLKSAVIAGVGFVAVGFFNLKVSPKSSFASIFCISFFGIAGVVWGYVLYLKKNNNL